MPGLQLYQTEADELELVKAALAEGSWLVPAAHYPTPEVDKLITIEEFQRVRSAQRHFYILSDLFMRAPLFVDSVTKEERAFFYVSPGVGGPSLEFLGGGIFADEATGEYRIGPGFLEFSRTYWTADLSEQKSSPPELEGMFKRLARVVKAGSTRIKPGKSVFWLGDDAKKQLKNGAKLVGYESWLLP